MRLGLFGGSFDPVHYGHLLLAESARQQRRLDQVAFLPAAVPPHKQGRELTPAKMRVEMLDLAIAGQPGLSVSRYEVDRGGISYTVETLRHYRGEDPDGELFFLLGTDMFEDLPNWRETAVVCELALPIVVRRAGMGEPDFDGLAGIASPERIDLIRRNQVEMPPIGLSSRDIRRRAAAGESIRFQTPRAVEEYIRTHNVYG